MDTPLVGAVDAPTARAARTSCLAEPQPPGPASWSLVRSAIGFRQRVGLPYVSYAVGKRHVRTQSRPGRNPAHPCPGLSSTSLTGPVRVQPGWPASPSPLSPGPAGFPAGAVVRADDPGPGWCPRARMDAECPGSRPWPGFNEFAAGGPGRGNFCAGTRRTPLLTKLRDPRAGQHRTTWPRWAPAPFSTGWLVKIVPGDLGTQGGLRNHDERARVLLPVLHGGSAGGACFARATASEAVEGAQLITGAGLRPAAKPSAPRPMTLAFFAAPAPWPGCTLLVRRRTRTVMTFLTGLWQARPHSCRARPVLHQAQPRWTPGPPGRLSFTRRPRPGTRGGGQGPRPVRVTVIVPGPRAFPVWPAAVAGLGIGRVRPSVPAGPNIPS